MQQQRTSNDVEGWHHRLNTYCSQQINVKGVDMYLLMTVLAKEAVTVPMIAAMLKQGHRLRLQRNSYIELDKNSSTSGKATTTALSHLLYS